MNQETAKNLFEYRKANGYSQEELALKIGAFTESEKSLKGEGYTTYGTGGASIEFESISGDLTIKKDK